MTSLLVDGLLKTIAAINPEYAPMINFVLAHETEIDMLAPIADAAVKEGPGAFAAAEKAAPELAQAIRQFVDATSATNAAEVRESVTRHMVGAAQAPSSSTSS
jgi:hypothetical protein